MSGRLARTSLAVALGFAALVTVQVLRLRRMEFLPLHPGFWVSHSVGPRGGRNAPSGPLRLIVFGDSTTAGVGVSRAEDSLPLVLAQRLADARGRSVAVLSYGWSGARMHDVLRDQLQRALLPGHQGQAPWLPTADVVIIVAGANDATHGTSPGRFRAALRATLEAIRREAPQAEITVAGIPRFRGALRQLEPLMSMIDAYAILLRGVQRQEARRSQVHYADLRRAVPRLAAREGLGIADVLATDHFHPSARGYRMWAEAIFDSLQLPLPDQPLTPRAAVGDDAGAGGRDIGSGDG